MQLLPLLTIQYSYLHYLQYNTATYSTYNTIQLLTLLTIQYSYLHYLQCNTATYSTYNTIQLLTLFTIQYSHLPYLQCVATILIPFCYFISGLFGYVISRDIFSRVLAFASGFVSRILLCWVVYIPRQSNSSLTCLRHVCLSLK